MRVKVVKLMKRIAAPLRMIKAGAIMCATCSNGTEKLILPITDASDAKVRCYRRKSNE